MKRRYVNDNEIYLHFLSEDGFATSLICALLLQLYYNMTYEITLSWQYILPT